MRPVEKMSAGQVILLLAISRLTVDYVYMPVLATPSANQDVWISIVLSVFFSTAAFWPMLHLTSAFRDMTLVEWLQAIMGKFWGGLLGLGYTGYLLLLCLLQLLLIANFLKSVILPETPEYAVLVLMAVCCVYAGYKGIECLGRVNQFFTPFILATIVVFTVLNYQKMDLKVFLPVLADSSLGGLTTGALSTTSRFAEIAVLPVLAPNLEKQGSIFKVFLFSLILFTVLFLVITVSTLAVLGTELAKHTVFPYYIFTRQVAVFDFIERVESLNTLAWFIGVFIKYTLFLYCAATCLAQVLRRKSYKAFLPPLAAGTLLIALYTPLFKSVNIAYVRDEIYPYIAVPFLFAIPALTLAVYFIRRKAVRQREHPASNR